MLNLTANDGVFKLHDFNCPIIRTVLKCGGHNQCGCVINFVCCSQKLIKCVLFRQRVGLFFYTGYALSDLLCLIMERSPPPHYNGYSDVLVTFNHMDGVIQIRSWSQLISKATEREWKVLNSMTSLCSNCSLVWHQTPTHDRHWHHLLMVEGLKSAGVFSSLMTLLCLTAWILLLLVCLQELFLTAHSDCREQSVCRDVSWCGPVWLLWDPDTVSHRWFLQSFDWTVPTQLTPVHRELTYPPTYLLTNLSTYYPIPNRLPIICNYTLTDAYLHELP